MTKYNPLGQLQIGNDFQIETGCFDNISLSTDGRYLVMGGFDYSNDSNVNTVKVEVFVREGNSWVKLANTLKGMI